MANITQLIKNIRDAIFGKEVRESIASAIEQCYEDASNQGNANMEVVDARGNYDTLKKRLEGDKTNLQSQINGLASGSPLVASSTAGMTDTSRVYVNTTDGHWYYYDGSTWADGGVYQSAEDSETIYNLVSNTEKKFTAIKDLEVEGTATSGNKIVEFEKINNNKMLIILKTSILTDTNLTVRELQNSTYTNNNKKLTRIGVQDGNIYYGYLTPTSNGTKYWVTPNENIENVSIVLKVYDASLFEISNELLENIVTNHDELDGFLIDLKNIEFYKKDVEKNYAKLISNIHNNIKTTDITNNLTLFSFDKINENKILVIVNLSSSTPSLAIRGLIQSTYSGNVVYMHRITNTNIYYGYITPLENETKYWITVSTSETIENVTASIKVYDASTFNISNDNLESILINYNVLDGFLQNMKNVSASLTVANEAKEIAEEAVELINETKPTSIVCWGDSLTQGAGSNNNHQYPTLLSNILSQNNYEYIVLNRGVGGDALNYIMNRQGALPIYIKPFSLPAREGENVSVTIQFYSNAMGNVNFQFPDDSNKGIKLCYLNGINYGYIIKNQDSTYDFVRTEDGNQIIFNRPVYLSFDNQELNNQISIIWGGTNDVNKDIDYMIDRQKAMVNFLKTDKYVVIGLICDIRHDIASFNSTMAKYWGRKFLDVQKYLVEFGLSDNNLEATVDDLQYISENKIPRTLMASDEIHLNNYGYIAVANCIYNYLVNEGYITKEEE